MSDSTIDDVMIGIKLVPDKGAEKVAEDSLRSFKRNALKILAPITGAMTIGKVFGMTKDIIEARDQSVILGKQLNINAGELYKLEQASSRFGTSFTDNLLNIQSAFSGIGLEDKSALAEGLGKFGVDIDAMWSKKNDPKAIFDELKKQWKDLSMGEKIGIQGVLGLDQGIVNILEDQERYERYVAETGLPSDEEMEEASKAKEAMDNLGITVQNLLNEIATELTPAIGTLSEAMGKLDIDKISDSINTMISFISKFFGTDEKESTTDTKDRDDSYVNKSLMSTTEDLEKEKRALTFSSSNPYSTNYEESNRKIKFIDSILADRESEYFLNAKNTTSPIDPKFTSTQFVQSAGSAQSTALSNDAAQSEYQKKSTNIEKLEINNTISGLTSEDAAKQFVEFISDAMEDTKMGNFSWEN